MLDWDDLRFFLALARHGSLSAAAGSLHVAQSTVGRRLASLEASLGTRLLTRTPHGYAPTLAGESVRERAEQLEAAALALERTLGGRDTRLAGLVRVGCVEAIASHILAPRLAGLRRQHPDITVELTPDPRDLDLSLREADISVRLSRPMQHDLVIRRVGAVAFALYASPAYLERHGPPAFDAGCAGHHLVAQHDHVQDAAQGGWLTELAPRARIAVQTGSHEIAVVMALHGSGLACLARFRADREAGLTRVPTPGAAPDADIWLAVHRDNRGAARIRAVMTHITGSIRARADLLCPPAAARDIAARAT